ncbi:MAG: InlB B-repeat-containing protein [Clostridia bacterium]|nr:InlB B-repeat-containing protein [Clostridia bacterium]
MSASFTNPEFVSQSKPVTLPKKNAITAFDGAEIDGNSILYVISKDTTSLNFSNIIDVPEDCTLIVLDTYNDPIEDNDTANIYPFEDGSRNDFKVKIVADSGEEIIFYLMVHKIYEITVTYKGYGYNSDVIYTEKIDSAQLYTPNPDYVNSFEGYAFNGFKDTSYNTYVPTILYKDTTVLVDRTPNTYTVTFDKNAGDLAGTTAEVTYGQVPSFFVPVLPGCTFLGWELNGQMITDNNGYGFYYLPWSKTEDCEVVAKWQRNNFFIEYHLDGGINNKDNITSYLAYDDVFFLKDPTKNDTLTVNSYKTAVLKAEEGSLVDYYTSNQIRVDRTAKKYEFGGWYKESTFDTRVTVLEFTYGTINLYAKWIEKDPVNETVDVDYLVVDKDGNYDPNGTYLLMGNYFQTVKSADVTIDTTLNGSNGWSVGSDGCLYKDVVAYTRSTDANKYYFSDNTKIVGGQTYYFKLEPMRWRMLNGQPDPEGTGWTVLMADKAISCEQYDNTTDTHYETSFLREFFNTNFLELHFNESMKNIMVNNPIDNSIKSTYEEGGYDIPDGTEKYWDSNNYLSPNTSDKIFALSISQLTKDTFNFSSSINTKDAKRTVTVTDYALAKGVAIQLEGEYKGNCTHYWTRSPYPSQSNNGTPTVFTVRYDGCLSYDYYGQIFYTSLQAKSSYVGVVPALRLDIRQF